MKNKTKVILLLIGCMIFLPVFVYFFLHFIFGGDIKPGEINDADLVLEAVNIPDEENAYFDLLSLSKLEIGQIDGYDDLIASDKIDKQRANKILDENRAIIPLIYSFLEKPYFQDPEFADPDLISASAKIVSYSSLRHADRILSLKALLALSENNINTAIENAFMEIYISQKLLESQSSLISYLVGLSIEKNGLSTLIRIANEINDPYFLSSINNKISDLSSPINKHLFKEEYITSKNDFNEPGFLKKYINSIVGDDDGGMSWNIYLLSKNNFYFKKNKTLNMIAKNTRKKIKIYQTSCSINIEPPKNKNNSNEEVNVLTENYFGKTIASFSDISLNSVRDKRCENNDLYAEVKEIINSKI